jgi:hypothetical protein
VFLGARLAPDMFPLTRQVQIACDFCKGVMAGLGGVENPAMADTGDQLRRAQGAHRQDPRLRRIGGRGGFAGAETRTLQLKAGPREFELQGMPYLVGYALPNLYFHMSMAYAILRHNGVDLGKQDFLGSV